MMDENDSPEKLFQPQTLVELLRTRAGQMPDYHAFLYLVDGEEEDASLTYAEMDQRARSLAAWLQQQGITGGRALLLYPPGLDFITAFFGCQYAGVVAVPAYPPRLNRPSPRIQAIVADAQVAVALTTTKIYHGLERRFDMMPELAALRWLNSEEMRDDLSGLWQDPGIGSDKLAFLQYTSGSTGSPKGVMLSHGNLLHNLEVIRQGFQIMDRPTGAFWLPSYHDMGLIGGILEPMYTRGRSILMAPAAFLQRPVRWLEAISRYRANISGAPNFAYQMCVDKISPEQREGLDLSCWKLAFSGAEPVRLETLDSFAETFAPYGFRRESFYPCYGLAEGTLLVSGGVGPSDPTAKSFQASPLGKNRGVVAAREVKDGVTLVGCGHALLDQQIVIADPIGLTACAPGEIGEIWIAGPSVAQGYWKRPELTEEIFHARLAGSRGGSPYPPGSTDPSGPFLRTGDLGFVHEGQLYITGRHKDLIIIRGRNYYPQDIEHTVAGSHPAFEPGMGAVFSIEKDGEERLVAVHEVKRRHRKPNMDEVVMAVRRAIAQNHELQLHALVLIKPLSIPKTSSGKIKRFACKAGFLDGTLRVINSWQAEERVPHVEEMHAEPRQGAKLQNEESVTAAALESWLVNHIAAEIKIDPQEIDVRQPFVDYGLDSVQAVTMTGQLENYLNHPLSPTLVWDYPTIRELAGHLASAVDSEQVAVGSEQAAVGMVPTGCRKPRQTSASEQLAVASEPIAVVGLGCRFPGADSPDAFWQLLADGVDAIREVPAERWDAAAYYDPDAAAGKMNTRWGGFLERIDEFDPQFFGISPREAARIDPQQRLMLEVAWEALENSGQAPSQLAGSNTAVFVGISSYDYSRFQFSDPQSLDIYAGTGNAHSIAANRLSYLLDLRGPSMAVDTACSSSLVAVHLACQSLRQGETDLAIAGGVNIILSPEVMIFFSQGRVMASDGRCKTFDARADGYVRSEGCGVVILKRLSEAVRDGDQLLAVIRGSAVNQDGRSNGLTAPNGRSQQAVIQQALANAHVRPADIGYIEAHGTGTPLGDPIEIHSLRAVYENGRPAGQTYAVGSVKTNVGHLESAAGIASLIKVVLSLQHEEIPAHLHYQSLNPHIDLTGSHLQIAAEKRPWPHSKQPRIAGISSFGFGGTNAHIIIGDPQAESSKELVPAKAGNEPQISRSARHQSTETAVSAGRERGHHLLTLSAKREDALHALARSYHDYLAEHHEVELADICYTANNGRSHFDHRLAVTAGSHSQMQKRLQTYIDGRNSSGLHQGQRQPRQQPKIAFLFTSPGAQYTHMGQELYETEPIFRAAIDRCAAILENYLDIPLHQLLYPDISTPESSATPAKAGENSGAREQAAPLRRQGQDEDSSSRSDDLIHNLAYTQPAMFALEYALVELWRSWGIEADVVMGHSMGEYVAAYEAGVFSLEEGLRLVTERGRLMQAAPQDGLMAVVFAQETQVEKALEPYRHQVSIAALNSPGNVVVSGEKTAVQALLSQLEKEGITSQPLLISHASHSPLMEPVLDEFESVLRELTFRPTGKPLVSNLTGKLLDSGEMLDASHWRRHLREPVRFSDGVQALADFGATIFIEIGPDPNLLALARRCLPNETKASWLPSLRQKRSDWQVVLDSLGALYTAGLSINWQNDGTTAQRRKVALPTYPFMRQRYWLNITAPTPAIPVSEGGGMGGDLTKVPAGLPIFELQVDTSNGMPLSSIVGNLVKQAAAELFDSTPDVLGDGDHYLQDLTLVDQPTPLNGRIKLQIIFIPETADSAAFQLFSHDSDQGTWQLRAHGSIQRAAGGTDQTSSSEGTLTQAGQQTLAGVSGTMPEVLGTMPEDERYQAVADFLIELAAQVMGLETDQMAVNQPLDTFGLDSLMALELKAGIEKSLGIALPIVNFLQGPTLTELATQLLDFIADPETAVPAIKAVSESGQPHPLSFNQQALWFLHELLPESVSFNVAGAVRIRGSLNVAALRSAFQKLIDRHPALRTTFAISQGRDLRHYGRPTQLVHTAVTIPFQEINALDWDEEVLEKYLVREAYSPFDLENGPIIKVRLLARPQKEYVLLLSMDHIIIELWSLSVLIQELRQFYLAEVTGSDANLPPLEIQYTDFVYWEADLLASAEGERQRAYWQKKLGGELPILDLPTDRPRPAVQTYAGDTVNLLLDSELTSQLRMLGQRQGATLFMTLLAGFQTLLHRYTGQDKLLVGSVLAGRERPELAQQIGYYINPVAMSADFSGNPSFESFLHQVRRTVLDAFANQNYPLPLLAESMAFVRDPSRPPLFETMLIMQKAQVLGGQGAENLGQSLSSFVLGMPNAVLDFGDMVPKNSAFTIESMRLPQMPAQFDLTLMIAEINGGLGVTFHYNRDLFDRATMERMLAHFATLLAGIAADPKRPLSTIPLLSPAEQKQLTLSQNQTKVAYPADDTICQLIEKQTEQTPDAIAIKVPKTSAICKESSVTYDQLNHRANQLALLLQKKGIAPGKLVGIYMDRSVDMVAGLLGILKAGGAYVPLDPAFPQERLALMLADAQPTLILTQQHLRQNLQTLSNANNIICIDNSQPLPSQGQGLAANVQADDLAYVIYTSGSTGRPKGVMVSHRNVVNFLTSMQNEPGLTANDTLLAVTTLSFDIAGLELFLPLTVGAKLIIATAAEASDGLRLQEIMRDSSVTVMQATPATWQLLLEAGWTGDNKLKILCGGEALPRKLANRLLERSRELWNMYGPTETTIWSTIYPVAPGEGPVPIGLPIANTQVYVLDEQMQPVPKGVVGDLYIGGDGVAPGYFKQPELTAEKFILHSFMVPTGGRHGADRVPKTSANLGKLRQTSVGKPSASSEPAKGTGMVPKTSASSSVILYKSGDKARLLSDGNLLFLGRDDHQVKVRGYRIELGDIESALEQSPAVKQAVVVARNDNQHGAEDLGQNKQLVGYLVLRKDADPTPTETFRAFLREKLPEYMIPAAFVILDTVPLTPNGKIDRKSLPAPSQSRPELIVTYVAPRTPLEMKLAEICADLLGLDKVGIYDNFFDLGGNSLLATRFIFQAREALQVQLPLHFLFTDSTVAGLSKAVMTVQEAGPDTGTVGTRQPSLFEEMSVAELNAEAVLDKSIPNRDLPLAAIKTPEHILLTGVTGFVGAFLLNDLLTKTKAHVHCLVRAETAAAGKERLRQNLETYNLWQEHFAGRISVVPGDLAQKRLRLTPRQFDELAQQIDVIYHNGAAVNLVYSYKTLKGSNVLGTQELLRLAGRYKLKAVHFVSTLSVLHTGAHDDGAVYFENDDLDQVGAPFGGYAKSKWVAEKLVMEAGRRGIPVAIYRPGIISGDSETGVTNTSDMMSSLMRVCLTTGTMPDLDIMIDIVPVNYVSGAIVQLSLHSDFSNQVFHLSNPQRMHYHDMTDWFKSTGYATEIIPFATWRDYLIGQAAQQGAENFGYGGGGWDAFLPLLEEADAKQAFMPAFDCQNSLAGLAGSDIIHAPVDADLLRKYLAYFERIDFI